MRKRVVAYVAGMLFFLYTVSLFLISRNQNPYHVKMESTEAFCYVNRAETGNLHETSIVITNHSNRTLSSQLNINLSYHLYRIVGDTQELVSIENIRTTIPNIYPEDSTEVRLQFEVPIENGIYILYADLIEENVVWYSERGMRTPYITIEVH